MKKTVKEFTKELEQFYWKELLRRWFAKYMPPLYWVTKSKGDTKE